MDYAREWALRCQHEAATHEDNIFVTLTYKDECLPSDYSVSRRDITLFMKRLRKHNGSGIRFFCVGEYGTKEFRPHYHLLLFGFRPTDGRIWRKQRSGHYSYRSPSLEEIWGQGHVEYGEVTFQSAAYCARYCIKKVNGDAAKEYYQRVNPVTGEFVHVRPEFIQMSNRPGIGSEWFSKYAGDCFPSDFVVHNGKKLPVPAYYLKKLTPEKIEQIKFKRMVRALKRSKVRNAPERLAAREEILASKMTRLKRDMEAES